MLYHFAGAIGPRQGRTPQCDPYTGEFDPTGYGPDEFLQLATQLGAEVTLVSPWVDGTPEEAAALVAYVNANPASTVPLGRDDNGTDWGTAGDWARRRAGTVTPRRMAFPSWRSATSNTCPPARPHRPRAVDLAVSARTSARSRARRSRRRRGHAQQVSRTRRLVRAVDSSIRIGALAFSPTILSGADELGGLDIATALAANDRATGDPWNVRLVEEAGADFDFFILHPYNLVTVPFSPPQDPLILAENLRQAVHQLRALDATKQIAVTEFGSLFFAASLLGALPAAQIVRVGLEEQLLMTLRHRLDRGPDVVVQPPGAVRELGGDPAGPDDVGGDVPDHARLLGAEAVGRESFRVGRAGTDGGAGAGRVDHLGPGRREGGGRADPEPAGGDHLGRVGGAAAGHLERDGRDALGPGSVHAADGDRGRPVAGRSGQRYGDGGGTGARPGRPGAEPVLKMYSQGLMGKIAQSDRQGCNA